MKLNGIEINILAEIELIDAYNKLIPKDFLNDNVIYCIHNKINNKNYIGQTINFKNRFSESYIGHFRDYNRFLSGELDSRILYRAWNKYGLASFIVYIIDVAESREDLDEKEIYWIKTLHTCTADPECLGYNLTYGGDFPSVRCEELIKRSLQARIDKYGTPWANCHTPEALAKGNKTKEEKYGHGGFVNAFTPEANEKRKQTNLERYGTTHGPKLTEESIKKMTTTKLEKYGDVMGNCNTPENRKKAERNIKMFYCFKAINRILLDSDKIPKTWEEYKELAYIKYKTKNSAKNHINRIVELLDYLLLDDRLTEDMKIIFDNLTEILNNKPNNEDTITN